MIEFFKSINDLKISQEFVDWAFRILVGMEAVVARQEKFVPGVADKYQAKKTPGKRVSAW